MPAYTDIRALAGFYCTRLSGHRHSPAWYIFFQRSANRYTSHRSQFSTHSDIYQVITVIW